MTLYAGSVAAAMVYIPVQEEKYAEDSLVQKTDALTRGQKPIKATTMPEVRELNGRKTFFVDDLPYLILGLQWDCDTCYSSDFAKQNQQRYQLASFLDRLAAVVKEIYPLPIYINCWLLQRLKDIPGKNYSNGGLVWRVLDVYRDTLHAIDFIAPEIYSHAYQSFREVRKTYSQAGSHQYIAEYSSINKFMLI
jgi:hypothetical protein